MRRTTASKTYSEKLKHPKWQRKRLEVLNLSNFRCEDCGAEDRTLAVHHQFYISKREPWEYEADQLRSLCRECHDLVEAGRRELCEALSRLSGPGTFDVVLGFAKAVSLFWQRSEVLDQDHEPSFPETFSSSEELDGFELGLQEMMDIRASREEIRFLVRGDRPPRTSTELCARILRLRERAGK